MHDEYEPLDLEHEAVVKDEPDDDGVPLDLDEIEDLYRRVHASMTTDEAATIALVGRVPHLLADLRAARERLAEWESLPTRQEYTVSLNLPSVGDPALPESSREQLASLADDTRRDLWARTLHVGPWERLDAEAPF